MANSAVLYLREIHSLPSDIKDKLVKIMSLKGTIDDDNISEVGLYIYIQDIWQTLLSKATYTSCFHTCTHLRRFYRKSTAGLHM